MKSVRRYADDGEELAFDVDGLADGAGASGEAAMPELVADDGDGKACGALRSKMATWRSSGLVSRTSREASTGCVAPNAVLTTNS